MIQSAFLHVSLPFQIVTNFRNTLRSAAPNSSAYEHDMDLRAEKEQQRGVLLKLRELGLADPDFAASCQVAVLDQLGLAAPTLSRLELRSSSSSAARSRSVSRMGGMANFNGSVSAGSR